MSIHTHLSPACRLQKLDVQHGQHHWLVSELAECLATCALNTLPTQQAGAAAPGSLQARNALQARGAAKPAASAGGSSTGTPSSGSSSSTQAGVLALPKLLALKGMAVSLVGGTAPSAAAAAGAGVGMGMGGFGSGGVGGSSRQAAVLRAAALSQAEPLRQALSALAAAPQGASPGTPPGSSNSGLGPESGGTGVDMCLRVGQGMAKLLQTAGASQPAGMAAAAGVGQLQGLEPAVANGLMAAAAALLHAWLQFLASLSAGPQQQQAVAAAGPQQQAGACARGLIISCWGVCTNSVLSASGVSGQGPTPQDTQAAFLAACSAVLCCGVSGLDADLAHTLGSNSASLISGSSSTNMLLQAGVVSLLHGMIARGLVDPASAVQLLCSPTRGPNSALKWDVTACSALLLGSDLLNTAVCIPSKAAWPAACGPNAQHDTGCEDVSMEPVQEHGITTSEQQQTHTYIHRLRIPMAVAWAVALDLGEASAVAAAMSSVPVQVLLPPVMDLLLPAICHSCTSVTGAAGAAFERAAAMAVAGNAAIRYSLLRDPWVTYTMLTDTESMLPLLHSLLNPHYTLPGGDGSGAAPLPTKELTLHLPTRLLILSLTTGTFISMQSACAHESACSADVESACSAVLSALQGRCAEQAWLLLRLQLDESALQAARGEMKGLKEALQEVLGSAAAAVSGGVGSQGASDTGALNACDITVQHGR